MKTIQLKDLTKDQAQAFADFLLKECYRHLDDITSIDKDLKEIKAKFGITPRRVFINTRIEV